MSTGNTPCPPSTPSSAGVCSEEYEPSLACEAYISREWTPPPTEAPGFADLVLPALDAFTSYSTGNSPEHDSGFCDAGSEIEYTPPPTALMDPPGPPPSIPSDADVRQAVKGIFDDPTFPGSDPLPNRWRDLQASARACAPPHEPIETQITLLLLDTRQLVEEAAKFAVGWPLVEIAWGRVTAHMLERMTPMMRISTFVQACAALNELKRKVAEVEGVLIWTEDLRDGGVEYVVRFVGSSIGGTGLEKGDSRGGSGRRGSMMVSGGVTLESAVEKLIAQELRACSGR